MIETFANGTLTKVGERIIIAIIRILLLETLYMHANDNRFSLTIDPFV